MNESANGRASGHVRAGSGDDNDPASPVEGGVERDLDITAKDELSGEILAKNFLGTIAHGRNGDPGNSDAGSGYHRERNPRRFRKFLQAGDDVQVGLLSVSANEFH